MYLKPQRNKGGLSNRYIVDFEGYYYKKYIIKEIAFYNIDTHQTENYFIKTQKLKDKTYYWLLNNFHLIPHNYGQTNFRTIKELLNRKFTFFVVKDQFKFDVLSKYTNNLIIVLTDSPPYSQLKDIPTNCCFDKHSYTSHCALKKVNKIANWYGSS